MGQNEKAEREQKITLDKNPKGILLFLFFFRRQEVWGHYDRFRGTAQLFRCSRKKRRTLETGKKTVFVPGFGFPSFLSPERHKVKAKLAQKHTSFLFRAELWVMREGEKENRSPTSYSGRAKQDP